MYIFWEDLYSRYGAASPFLEIYRRGCLGGDAKRSITADAYLIEILAKKMKGYLSQLPISYTRPAALTAETLRVSNFLEAINLTLHAQARYGSSAALIALPNQGWDGAFGKRERIIGTEVDLHFANNQALQDRSFEIRVLHPSLKNS